MAAAGTHDELLAHIRGYAELVAAYDNAPRCHDDVPTAGRPSSIGTRCAGPALSPELFHGLAVTLVLAMVMTASRAAAPVAIQHGIDDGLRAPGGPDLGVVASIATVTGLRPADGHGHRLRR